MSHDVERVFAKYKSELTDQYGFIRQQGWGHNGADVLGDSCWRSSWWYASELILRRFSEQRNEYAPGVDPFLADTESRVALFLEMFDEHCAWSRASWRTHPDDARFSKDQVAPLFFLLGVIAKLYRDSPTLNSLAKKIVQTMCNVDHARHGFGGDHGKIHHGTRYLILVLASDFGIDYEIPPDAVGGRLALEVIRRSTGIRSFLKTSYNVALESKIIGIFATGENVYSAFNELAHVSMLRSFWGNADADIQRWRGQFNRLARAGHGEAYEIVTGRDVSAGDITKYGGYSLNYTEMLSQRGKEVSTILRDPDRGGDIPVMDLPVLAALQLLWNHWPRTATVPDAIVHEESITITKGQALLLDIQRADNEITVVLDGSVKYYEHFWEQVGDTLNFSGIDEGEHVLVISVDNHGYPIGSSISRIEFRLHHHDQVEHVNEKTHANYRQGLVYQYIYIITVKRPDG